MLKFFILALLVTTISPTKYTNLFKMLERVGMQHENRGNTHKAMGFYLQGISIDPSYIDFRFQESSVTPCAIRERLVESFNQFKVKNKTIYVYYEGDFSDIIMFSRYLNYLSTHARKVIFHPPEALFEVFNQSNTNYEVTKERPKTHHYDIEVPLLALPHLLHNPEISGDEYLHINQDITIDDSNLKVGIMWQEEGYISDIKKSVGLSLFYDLAQVDGTTLYSLQSREVKKQIEKIPKHINIVDLSTKTDTFEKLAGVIKALDIIVTIDTYVAHLAGALGKPVLILIPYTPDFRWLYSGKYTMWYKSARLVRQQEPGIWQEALEEISDYLKEKT